ncbi:MAG: response regulator [Gemmatimonadota bacterium]
MLPTRILIVEDSPPIRLALRIALERLGFEVVDAADGRSGVRHALRHLPDLVLIDLEMPGMDGWQLLRALRQDFRTCDLPAIATTLRDEVSPGTAHSAGFGGLLRMPFTVSDLYIAITRVTRGGEKASDTSSPEPPCPPRAA